MKKYIFSVLMAAMAVFTFSSCEDVPAPYATPNLPSTPDTPEVTTDGTEANPYTVTDAKTVGSGTDVFVKGYIVGFIPDKSLSEAVFSAENAVDVNVIIAASADETDVNKCMPVQLPAGEIRTAVNLKDNAANLGQEVLLCGSLESYFGTIGVKSTSYAKIGSKEAGKKPGSETGPIGEAKGTGTEADPFNSVAAYNEALKLEKGSTTDQEYYIKGKIISFVAGKDDTGEFNAKYGNASFKVADDETSTQFYIFRTNYFGGEKWKEGDTQIKVGDEVVICGKLTNYNGTLETAQGGKLISINGQGGSVTPDPTPDTPTADEGKVVIDQEKKTTTLENSSVEAGESVTFDFTTQGYENGKETGTITLTDGTTIDFDANGETNGPKYYTSGTAIRVYKNNKIVITGSKKIAKIVFNCTNPTTSTKDGVTTTTYYTGNETATVSFSGNTVTYTNVFTGTSGGGTQVRLKSIEIAYAK